MFNTTNQMQGLNARLGTCIATAAKEYLERAAVIFYIIQNFELKFKDHLAITTSQIQATAWRKYQYISTYSYGYPLTALSRILSTPKSKFFFKVLSENEEMLITSILFDFFLTFQTQP